MNLLARIWYALGQLRQTMAKASKDSSFRIVPAIALIQAHAKLPRGAKILDLGCRNAIEPRLLREAGWDVDPVDLWPMALGIRRGDMHALPCPDRAYDLVFASHCLEHAHTPDRALAETSKG